MASYGPVYVATTLTAIQAASLAAQAHRSPLGAQRRRGQRMRALEPAEWQDGSEWDDVAVGAAGVALCLALCQADCPAAAWALLAPAVILGSASVVSNLVADATAPASQRSVMPLTHRGVARSQK